MKVNELLYYNNHNGNEYRNNYRDSLYIKFIVWIKLKDPWGYTHWSGYISQHYSMQNIKYYY